MLFATHVHDAVEHVATHSVEISHVDPSADIRPHGTRGGLEHNKAEIVIINEKAIVVQWLCFVVTQRFVS